MILVSGFILLVFISYCLVRQSFSAKFRRRIEIQQQFEYFTVSNQLVAHDQYSLDSFLEKTRDIKTYYSSPVILQLRRELYDRASQISQIRKTLNDIADPDINRFELLESYRTQKDWFIVTANNMDRHFSVEAKQYPDFFDVLREGARLFRRSVQFLPNGSVTQG